MTTWLREHLVCPVDASQLSWGQDQLVCDLDSRHTYPIYDGIPVMSRTDVEPTQSFARNAVLQARGDAALASGTTVNTVDWFVQENVVGTCGYLYMPLRGRLTEYPIPEIHLPRSTGKRLLDIGCNWGRWLVAAARKGYRPVGVDVNLDALLAAKRVCRDLGVEADVVVGDGRFLPFADGTFDVVHSYSVIQHFSKPDARLAVASAARVLAADGRLVVQMPNRWGVRSLQHQARRWGRAPVEFDVRYWSPNELRMTFGETVGAPAELEVDGFFGLGIQAADRHLMPFRYKAIVSASETLRTASRWFGGLKSVADSLYVVVQREPKLLGRSGKDPSAIS